MPGKERLRSRRNEQPGYQARSWNLPDSLPPRHAGWFLAVIDIPSTSSGEARQLLFVSSVATDLSTAVPGFRPPLRPNPSTDRLRTGSVIAFTPEHPSASAGNRDRHHAGTLIGFVRNMQSIPLVPIKVHEHSRHSRTRAHRDPTICDLRHGA